MEMQTDSAVAWILDRYFDHGASMAWAIGFGADHGLDEDEIRSLLAEDAA